jgi:hypothetical protein
MKACNLGRQQPTLFELKALAFDELHGDGFADVANHVRNCICCMRRMRALQITLRCNQALTAIDNLPVVTSIKVPIWRKVESGILELRERITVILGEGHQLAIEWADGISITASHTELQFLSEAESTMLERKLLIGQGEGVLACSLCIYRDPKGVIRIGVDFESPTAQNSGRLRLLRGNKLIEARNFDDDLSLVFKTTVEPGDYIVELHTKDTTHRIQLTVDE